MPAIAEWTPEVKTASEDTTRQAIESSFVASDGQRIAYRYWAPRDSSDQAVLLFHRGHEHSGRWQQFVDQSKLDDCWFFAWDARGHGKTEGERGAAESFGRMVRDADEFACHIAAEFGIEIADMAVVGQSVGAVLAATWIHDYARPVRAMVLATPAFRIKLYVPFAIPGLRVLKSIRPQSFIKSYVRPGMLTGDKQQANEYANDPLVSPQIAVNILLDLHDTSTRLVNDAASIHTPTLMFVSGKDYVVRQDVQQEFFNRLSSRDKHLEVLPEFLHSTFWERGRDRVIEQSGEFLKQRFAQPTSALSSRQLTADSSETYAQLQQPTSLPRKAYFGIQRTLLASFGRLSKGVQIGWKSGFDSGQSLDHVYRNRAEGVTPIGHLIDRSYLNSIGWRGIRQRKVHMERLLDEAIEQSVREFGEARILDIAAGPGRYVLDTLQRNHTLPVRAILCDRDPGGIAEGRQLAGTMGLEDRVEFRCSDAFDPEAIVDAAGDRRATIVIASGLYELFPDNEPVARSLSGLSRAVVDGGWLLFTDQPWHPQQEMIARVLPNRDGDPWVMRCRSQREMNTLASEAGFDCERVLVDAWGIFSVATARKRNRR